MATLCTLDDVRQALAKSASDTAQDALLTRLIAAATQAIHAYTQRELCDQGDATRLFQVATSGTRRVVPLGASDLRSATTITLHPESTTPVELAAAIGYQLRPVGQTTIGTYTLVKLAADVDLGSEYADRFGAPLVEINGAWGPAATPDDAKHYAIQTVKRWYDRHYAHRTTPLDPDDEPAAIASVASLPADVRAGLAWYRRRPVA